MTPIDNMKFTGKLEKRKSIQKMQLRCDAGQVHCYLYKCRSWPRIGGMSCGSARVLEVKVKMRRFREKEMMGRRVGGKVEPVYEPISFSAKASPLLYLLFQTPQSAISRPPALSGGQIVCSTTILLHSEQSENISRRPHIYNFRPSAHREGQGDVQIANWSLVRNRITYFSLEWVLFPPFSHLRRRK